MPSLQELEQFRASFRAVGGESTTLAARGEFYADFELPDETEEASAGMDFGAFLDSVPDALEHPVDEGVIPEDLLSGFAEEIEAERSHAADEGSAFGSFIPDGPAAKVPESSYELPSGLDFGVLDEAVSQEETALDLIAEVPAAADLPEDLAVEEPAADAPGELSAEDLGLDADFSFEGGSAEADAFGFDSSGIESPTAEEPSGLFELPSEDASGAAPGEGEIDESFSLFSEEAPAPETGEDTGLPGSEEESFDFSIPEFGSPEAAFPSPAPGSTDLGTEPQDSFPSEPSGLDETPLDSFDTFSLDDSALSAGFGFGEPKVGGSDSELGVLEEFSLAGIDDVFGTPKSAAVPTVGRRGSPGRSAAVSHDVEEIRLSEDDFARLEESLASYPLNLRIACEELIAEQAVAPDLMSSLVKALVRGAPAKETASLAGKILGRTITIPRGFEKRSGEALEAERSTFAYAFVHQFFPILRIFAFVAVVAASAVYLGFEFIYTPLRAESLYKAGYEQIAAGEYERANERFAQALSVQRKKRWFFTYAEAFRDRRQFIHAQGKYDELLRHFPRDKKGVLDYASMESTYLRNYAKADRLIRTGILDYDVDDREGLLALGDVNLAWGDLDPGRYEEARIAFARLMEKYGRQDPFLERMLIYFMRTDNLAEVLSLQGHFMSSPRTKIGAFTLGEMGGYLLDKKLQELRGVPDENISRIEGLREVFDRAIRLDPALPESHYHLAKYFNRFGTSADERRTLERALNAFQDAPELSARRVGYRIDAHRRLALLLRDNREFITAEERLVAGISLYEDAVARRILARSEQFGRLYADLGDIEYFRGGDLAKALRQYQNARMNGWAPPEIRYRVGAAHYMRREWAEAVEAFFESSLELPLNRRLLFSLGNASYMRGNFHAAQGYYNRLLDMLEAERSRFPMLLPNDRPDHLELAERIMRARNNLGVVMEALAENTGNNGLRARALALYAESARAWDALTRNPVSMVRSASKNLAYLNTRNSLYPERGYEAQLYMEIDKDMLEPSPWEELLGR